MPPLREAAKAAGVSLLEIDVGGISGWKTPAHPLRTDPGLKVSSIPTFIEWTEDGASKNRLGERVNRE